MMWHWTKIPSVCWDCCHDKSGPIPDNMNNIYNLVFKYVCHTSDYMGVSVLWLTWVLIVSESTTYWYWKSLMKLLCQWLTFASQPWPAHIEFSLMLLCATTTTAAPQTEQLDSLCTASDMEGITLIQSYTKYYLHSIRHNNSSRTFPWWLLFLHRTCVVIISGNSHFIPSHLF